MNEAAINSLNRVIQHFEHNAFAIISASRGIYSKEENDQRTDELKSISLDELIEENSNCLITKTFNIVRFSYSHQLYFFISMSKSV